MECNRDQSDDCYNRAVKFLRDGNTEKAIYFLEKSNKLYPNARAQHLLEQLQQRRKQQEEEEKRERERESEQQEYSENDSYSSSSSYNEDYRSETPNGQSNGTPVDTSDIEDEDIKRILEAGDDYYKIFDLPKTATVAEIKKKYRKLAIKTHPDKSTSKELGQAYGCLSDEEKKRFYDTHGFDSSQSRAQSAQTHQTFYRRRGFTFQNEDDIDPDEIFRFFFGGAPFYQYAATGNGGTRPRVYRFGPSRYSRARAQMDAAEEEYYQSRKRQSSLLGIIVFVAFFMLLNFMGSNLTQNKPQEPKFSFSPSPKYNMQRTSEIFNAKYYVPSSVYTTSSNKALKDIDFDVDQNYISTLERRAKYYGRNSGYYAQYMDALATMKRWKENGGKRETSKFSFEEDDEFTEKRVSSIFQIEYYVKPSKSDGPLGEGTSDLKEINDIDLSVDKYYLNSLKKDNPNEYEKSLEKFNEWNTRVKNK